MKNRLRYKKTGGTVAVNDRASNLTEEDGDEPLSVLGIRGEGTADTEVAETENAAGTRHQQIERAGRLREFLKTNQLRQSTLRQLGLGVASINQYVNGKVRLPNYVTALLTFAYGLNKEWLATGTGTMVLREYVKLELKATVSTSLNVIPTLSKATLETQGKRLREFLEALGIRQSHLTRIGISSSMFSQYLNARVRIPSYIVALLIFAYALNPDWLQNGTGELFLSKDKLFNYLEARTTYMSSNLERKSLGGEKLELRPIRHLGVIAAGEPIPLPDDWTGEYSWVTERIIGTRHAEDFYTLTVRGNSMIDADIHDGDQVIIRYQNTADHGEIAVVSIDDEATLKQVFFRKKLGMIELRPCNKELKPRLLEVSRSQEIKVHGVLVGLLRQ